MSTELFVGSVANEVRLSKFRILIGTAFQIKQTRAKNEYLLALIVDDRGIRISTWLRVGMVFSVDTMSWK